jgi:hypothetical protein
MLSAFNQLDKTFLKEEFDGTCEDPTSRRPGARGNGAGGLQWQLHLIVAAADRRQH